MEDLYSMIGISKQGHYKRIKRITRLEQSSVLLIKRAEQLRREHPKMGCKRMSIELKTQGLGRDKSMEILLKNGFRVKRKYNFHRTTYSGKEWYPNLIQGIELNDSNQLWVSDITYLPVGIKSHYYLTLILDVYTRKLVGWSLSKDLLTLNTVLPAYQMAIHTTSLEDRMNLIFHSDRGSQYYHYELREAHEKNLIRGSMGGKAWENGHAERINGILKEEYLDFIGLNVSFKEVKKTVESVIKKYNLKRPHSSINYMKPIEFETYIKTLKIKKRPIFKINY
jgi:transposase InsO family protein